VPVRVELANPGLLPPPCSPRSKPVPKARWSPYRLAVIDSGARQIVLIQQMKPLRTARGQVSRSDNHVEVLRVKE
jgi:hypothetical protein